MVAGVAEGHLVELGPLEVQVHVGRAVWSFVS